MFPEQSGKRDRSVPGLNAESRELIAGFLQGERPAVSTIAAWAQSVARHQAWGFESPEDVVQATMLALVQNFRGDKFVGGNLRAYVRRIAKNLCITSYRKVRSRGEHVSFDDTAPTLAAEPPAVDTERRVVLETVLGQLDEDCRRIVLLAYVHGHTRGEIAQRLDISVEAARVRLFRCLHRARSMFPGGEL